MPPILPYDVNLDGLDLSGIVAKIRTVPMSNFLFKQLDTIYQRAFLSAETGTEIGELRAHIAYITGFFLPSFHIDHATDRRQYEVRWAMLVALCDERLKEFERVRETLTAERKIVLEHISLRENSEFGLLESFQEFDIEAALATRMLKRVPIVGRQHPLRRQDYTLQLTQAGREAIEPKS